MGNILLVGETTEALNQLRSIISKHLKQADIHVVKPENALGLLLFNRISLTVYVVSPAKKPDLGVISEIRSVSSKLPLLIYGDFDFSPYDVTYLLSGGVHGLLPGNSNVSEYIKAIDSLLRGDPYVNDETKRQVVCHLLG